MEQEPRENGRPPIISEQTADRLKEEWGLDISKSTASVLEGITKEKQLSPLDKIEQMVADVFYDVASVNSKFAEALHQGVLKGLFLSDNINRRNSTMNGMALIIKAFHLESDFNLIERFGKINDPQSLARVSEIVQKSLGEGKEMDMIERALKIRRIPDVQVNLNNLVEESAKKSLVYSHELRIGASAMYYVLSEFGSRLFSLPNSSQNPPAIPSSI